MTYFSVTQGDDRTLTITASSSLEDMDLTWTARHRRYSEDVVIEKTTGSGITTGSAPFRTAVIALDAADTRDLDPDVLYWDLQIVDGQAKTTTVASGRLAVEGDVTRP